MNLIADTVQWFTMPEHWVGPQGVPTRLLQHVALTLSVTLVACAIALPLGGWMGHRRRGDATIAAAVNASRALPTLGLVTLFALWLGIGLQAPFIALTLLALPSILAATFAGISTAPAEAVDASRAVGHRGWQTLVHVEVPLALPVIGGGIQSAFLQVVATGTIAAYVADIGLGRYIFSGLRSADYAEMLAGSVLTILLALLIAAAGAIVGRAYRHLTLKERII